MNVSKYHNLRDEQIIALIEDCVQDGISRQEEICQHLQELSKRKVRHKLHKHALYKWYGEVATGKLLMSLVALFSGKKQYLDHLVGRSLDTQRTIRAEQDVTVAQVDRKTGEIVEVRKPAIKMNVATFQRVFPKGKSVATFTEQRSALEAELEAKPTPVVKTKTRHGPIVKADKVRHILKVGNTEVPLSVIRTALAEIGLEVRQSGDDLNLDLLA